MSITLELDGVSVPLPEGTELAINYRAHDIRNLGSRDNSYAESLTLPDTNQNRRLLGNSQFVNSATTSPYRFIPATIRYQGNPVLTGFAAHTQVQDGFSVEVDGPNADLFTAVKGKKLSDIDLSDLDHTWTNTEVRTANPHDPTRGYVYPLINYGRFTGRYLAPGNVRYDELYPAVYVRTLLERMIAPYTLTGTLLLDERFQKLVIPFTNDEFRYRESYRQLYDVEAKSNQVESYSVTNTPVRFNQLIKDETGLFAAQSKYVAFRAGNYQVDITLLIDTLIPDDGTNGTTQVELIHRRDPVETQVFKTDLKDGRQQEIKISYTVENALSGDLFFARIWPAFNSTGTTVLPGSSFQVTHLNRVFPGQPVHLEANLPDITQEQLLLTLCNMFNLLIRTNPALNTVQLDSLERLRWETPVDWSKKVDWSSSPGVQFALSDYAQDNILQYLPTEETRENPESRTEAVVFATANSRLEPEKVFFESEFTFTETLPAFRQATTLPYIPLWQQEWQSFSLWSANTTYYPEEWVIWNYDYYKAIAKSTSAVPDEQPGKWVKGTEKEVFSRLEAAPRLMVLTERLTADGIHVGADYNPNTGQLLTTSAAGLTWQTLNDNYHTVTGRLLLQARILSLRVRLKLTDINRLDFLRPVVLNIPARNLQGVFYLNAVNQFNPASAQSTEVELVRLYGQPLPTSNTHKEFTSEFTSEFN